MTFSEYIERESGKEGRADGGRKAGSELRERERGEGEGERRREAKGERDVQICSSPTCFAEFYDFGQHGLLSNANLPSQN